MASVEASREERWGLGAYPVASVFGEGISANDTLIVDKRDYPDLIMYVKVDSACDVVLDAVSGVRRKPDGSYAKISVNEVIASFSAAGEQIIRLSNVLTKKWALYYPFLHLKFTAATTIDLVALPVTTTLQEAKIVGDDVGLATEATLSDIKNALASVGADEIRTNLQDISIKKVELYDADETLDQSISLDIGGYKLVEVACSASAPTTFTVEYSFDNTHWFTYYTSSSAETSYNDVFWTAAQYIRVSSAAAGAAGYTVSLVIAAKP